MDFEQMVRWYFAGEKAEAFWILAAGVVSLGAAVVLWFWARDPFSRGLAMALLIVAGLGFSVGGTVYFRSDAQAQQLVEQRASDAAQFAAEEGPRIATVIKSFGLYRIGYAVAVLLALFFVFVMGKPSQHGFAVGLLLLAALGLTIDFYAERRAQQYRQGLQAVGALP
jgi:drug/metabolite transporter (DMT)-like permease